MKSLSLIVGLINVFNIFPILIWVCFVECLFDVLLEQCILNDFFLSVTWAGCLSKNIELKNSLSLSLSVFFLSCLCNQHTIQIILIFKQRWMGKF